MQGDDNEASAGQDKENRVKAKSEKFDPGRKVEEKKNEKHSGFTELSVVGCCLEFQVGTEIATTDPQGTDWEIRFQ
jgi:hypothetical protein